MNLKILIVDDEDLLADLLSSEIEDEYGAEVTLAVNGAEALALCKENQYSLVITDFKMPIMDGGALISELKTNLDYYKEVPIILMTAYAPDNLDCILDLPRIKFLKKPFRFENIAEIINELI